MLLEMLLVGLIELAISLNFSFSLNPPLLQYLKKTLRNLGLLDITFVEIPSKIFKFHQN